MVSVRRTFSLKQEPERVVRYLRDFAHAEQWDPGTKTCVRVGTGEVGVGTTWKNTSEFLGRETELSYELVQDSADHLIFRGTNKTATSTDDLTIVAEGTDSTQLTYVAIIEFNGVARFAGPFVKPAFEKLATKTVAQMTSVLEGLGPVD